MKKGIVGALMALALLMSCTLPIHANSAQTRWYGVDSTGAVVVDEDCPIEVSKEILTFELAAFPSNHYESLDEYLAYTGRVTAEYTFYNPTDLTVTATLAFPFGNQPDYAVIYDAENGVYRTAVDTEKYAITVNGNEIEKKVRYTVNSSLQFNVATDVGRLQDSYMTDDFYSPDITVTEYTYIVGGVNKDCQLDEKKYPAATVAFDWDGGEGGARIYFPASTTFHTQKDGDGRFGLGAENGTTFSVYVIGEPLATPLEFLCYEDGGTEDGEVIEGGVELASTETVSFEVFVLTRWSEETGVSRVDWYNAALTRFREGVNANTKYNFIYDNFDILTSAEGFLSGLMRWYEYEITLAPKESLINSVTAPMYPSIDLNYIPSVCTYTYLLSPAATWAHFGELEIVVNTPYYITQSSLSGFIKTEEGYVLNQNGLPSGELVFSMSSAENPQRPQKDLADYIPFEMMLTLSVWVGAALLIGGGIAAFVIVRRKKRQ